MSNSSIVHMNRLKTSVKRNRDKRDDRIRKAYQKMMADNSMKSAVVEALAEKFDLSTNTIYAVIKRSQP